MAHETAQTVQNEMKATFKELEDGLHTHRAVKANENAVLAEKYDLRHCKLDFSRMTHVHHIDGIIRLF